jgi:hypothetical protein
MRISLTEDQVIALFMMTRRKLAQMDASISEQTQQLAGKPEEGNELDYWMLACTQRDRGNLCQIIDSLSGGIDDAVLRALCSVPCGDC